MLEGVEIGLACCRCHGAKYGGNRLRGLRRKPSCSRPVSERRRTKDRRPKTEDFEAPRRPAPTSTHEAHMRRNFLSLLLLSAVAPIAAAQEPRPPVPPPAP